MAKDPDDNMNQTPADGAVPDADAGVAEALAQAQASVDQLKEQTGAAAPPPEASPEAPPEAPTELPPEDAEAAALADAAAEGSEAVKMEDLAADASALAGSSTIDMLGDVDLHVTIELGRTQMLVEDVLKLNEGAVVELDKLAGDPVDVYVNDCLIARGEVLVLNDNFCIRVSTIVENLEEHAEQAAHAQAQAS